jgi:hypothetical protein
VAGEDAQIRTAHYVPAGADRFRGKREVFGSRVIDFKVDELARLGSSPRREDLQRAFSSHGLEYVGPPLSIE